VLNPAFDLQLFFRPRMVCAATDDGCVSSASRASSEDTRSASTRAGKRLSDDAVDRGTLPRVMLLQRDVRATSAVRGVCSQNRCSTCAEARASARDPEPISTRTAPFDATAGFDGAHRLQRTPTHGGSKVAAHPHRFLMSWT
jgi:hypothetical protein